MHRIRTLASYYRQNHLRLLGDRAPCGRQLFVGRKPETLASEQARRQWTGLWRPSSFVHNEGRRADHDNGAHKMEGNGSEKAPPPPPAPRKPSFYTWGKCAFGSMLALLLSIWSTRWQRLLLIGSEVEKAMQVAETATEIVEEVAAVAEKVSAEVVEKLPDGGKLKEAALAVENASKEAVAGAQAVEDIIHKVDELEEEVKSLLKPDMDPSHPTKDHK